MSRKEVFTRVKSRLLYYADHQSQNQPQNQNSEPAGGKSQLGPGSRSRSGLEALVGNLKILENLNDHYCLMALFELVCY